MTTALAALGTTIGIAASIDAVLEPTGRWLHEVIERD
jgi:hypothetical protein